MKALFIGGTGLISSAVSRLAVERGIELALLNRGQRGGFFPAGARHINADARDAAAVRKALGKETFDVVVDWIVFTPEQLEADIALFAGRTAQYIFISSASAYQKPAAHYLITESTPLANPYWQYSRDKIACEEILMHEYQEKGFSRDHRPSFTYVRSDPDPRSRGELELPLDARGPDAQGQEDHRPGGRHVPVDHDPQHRLRQGLRRPHGQHPRLGHAFHITSDEVLTWDQIIHAIGAAAGARPDIVHIASEFIAAFSPEDLGNLLGDKAQCGVFDNAKIKSFVPGFVATMPFSEGVRQSVQWFESHPERCGIDAAFNALSDRIIAAYQKGLDLAKS